MNQCLKLNKLVFFFKKSCWTHLKTYRQFGVLLFALANLSADSFNSLADIPTPPSVPYCTLCGRSFSDEASFNAHFCPVHGIGCQTQAPYDPYAALRQEANNLRNQAINAWNEKDWDKAADLYDQAADKFNDAHEPDNAKKCRNKVHFSKAEGYWKQARDAWDEKDWDTAYQFYNNAAGEYDSADDSENAENARENAHHSRAQKYYWLGDAAWKKSNWDNAIYYNQLAYDEDSDPQWLKNIEIAKNNKLHDSANSTRKLAKAAWENNDWDYTISAYYDAADKYEQSGDFKAAQNARDSARIAKENKAIDSANVARKQGDKNSQLHFLLQAQAFAPENNSLDENISDLVKNLPQGIPTLYPESLNRSKPILPPDKNDALFQLRVEKTYADNNIKEMQSGKDVDEVIKQQSSFVFDVGRYTTPAPLPDVATPTASQAQEALHLVQAALILPRSAIEQPNAPTEVKNNPVLVTANNRQNQASTDLEGLFDQRRKLFLDPHASPQALANLVNNISKKEGEVAFQTVVERAAAGTPYDANFTVSGGAPKSDMKKPADGTTK